MTKIAFLFLILIIKHSQGDDYDGDGLGEIKATIDEVQKDVKGLGKFLEELTQLFKKHFPVPDDAESFIGSKESSITTSDPELLLIGPGDGSTQSEVINLSTFSSTNCRIPKVPNIDGDWHSYVATMTPDGPLFCGGNTGQYSSDVTNCRLLIKTGVWVDVPPSMEMRGPRAGAAAVHFDNGWWVTGGHSSSQNTKSSTEIWDNKTWRLHTPLPLALNKHCLVKVNSTHVFLAGGEMKMRQGRGSSSTFSNSAYLYSKEAGFVQQADMPGDRGYLEIQCVLVGEGLVMVAGGRESYGSTDKDTKYFNLSTLEWSSGPRLPHTVKASRLLSINDRTILIGGGKIWEFKPLELSTGPWWVWMEIGKLEVERKNFDVVQITREYCANNNI